MATSMAGALAIPSKRRSELIVSGLAAFLRLTKSTVDGVAIASGVAGALSWITDTALQFKTNKDDWQHFSEYASALCDDIQLLVNDSVLLSSSELSADISKLQAPLLRIITEMQKMQKRSIISKFLQAQEDPKKISAFRQMIADASVNFSTTQLVAIRIKLECLTAEKCSINDSNSDARSFQMKACSLPSHLFTGRQGILNYITQYFAFQDDQKQHVFVLYGLGGSGKSQLAFKFVRDSQVNLRRFSEVFMIDATTSNTIENDLKNIALAKGIGDSADAALHWLAAQAVEWLVLFDNADDVDLNIRKYFPPCLHGNILITTRNHAVCLHGSGSGSHFNVAEMDPADAERLLMRVIEPSLTVANTTEVLIATLAKELNWFALALIQMSFVRGRED